MKEYDITYEGGVAAARAYYNSQAYGSLTRYVRPADAIRLFLPPIQEQMTQMATPLPKDRQDWMHGFSDEQKRIQKEKRQ